MARSPIPTWYYVLVVVRRGDRFLVTQEAKHGQLWYLPAGRVEPGEDFREAALREVREETGIPVVLEGILKVQHTPHQSGGARLRIIFLARPADETPPKQSPDEESLQAAWVTLDDLDRLPLRSEEVREIFHAVARGAPMVSLTMLGLEGESLGP